jgi:hypothetical protein
VSEGVNTAVITVSSPTFRMQMDTLKTRSQPSNGCHCIPDDDMCPCVGELVCEIVRFPPNHSQAVRNHPGSEAQPVIAFPLLLPVRSC